MVCLLCRFAGPFSTVHTSVAGYSSQWLLTRGFCRCRWSCALQQTLSLPLWWSPRRRSRRRRWREALSSPASLRLLALWGSRRPPPAAGKRNQCLEMVAPRLLPAMGTNRLRHLRLRIASRQVPPTPTLFHLDSLLGVPIPMAPLHRLLLLAHFPAVQASPPLLQRKAHRCRRASNMSTLAQPNLTFL